MRIHVVVAENSAPWDLTLDSFRMRLGAYRPDARTDVRTQGGSQYLFFDLDFDGERYEGGYFPDQQLILWDASIEAWAPVIVWFLNLLPHGANADCFLESVAIPQEVPRNATVEEVTRILTTLDASY